MASPDVPRHSAPECFGQAPCIGCLWRRECEKHRERAERKETVKRRERKGK